ncbi:hypothetical protein SAICODRAFT_69595 [Saitoella complicata NRRL Y-17804]|uniref:Developmental regulatory protein wetA n=1 Tax=Saitoella complicata (strain BCRC 22490 / CBS 7301 / JCM 7358 / NBRC 10748 / NRRL Y-17804) TaxID=698492 RepID=A0A0E9NIZ9_SAICN|nr:uncharacterized protein SAICODRAFT_69595 [Saitoella complicata NRRL Y-17804]ODQ54950.1 hypothetical protein SAICODRAFT_69595 [Saitoella complicata NRRL Y-17804]GAO49852.1 hypothetical protein G7K_3989-t1 [Saitoella complicata NRRL Y-17804]
MTSTIGRGSPELDGASSGPGTPIAIGFDSSRFDQEHQHQQAGSALAKTARPRPSLPFCAPPLADIDFDSTAAPNTSATSNERARTCDPRRDTEREEVHPARLQPYICYGPRLRAHASSIQPLTATLIDRTAHQLLEHQQAIANLASATTTFSSPPLPELQLDRSEYHSDLTSSPIAPDTPRTHYNLDMATATHTSQQNQWRSLQLPANDSYQDHHEQPYFHLQSQPMTKTSSAPYDMPRQQPSSPMSRRRQNRGHPGPLAAPLDLASAYQRYTLPTSGQVSPLSGTFEPQPMSRKRSHEVFADSDSSPVMMGFATPMTADFTWGGGDMMGTPTKRICANPMGIEYGLDSPYQQVQRHEISEYMPVPAELPYTSINHFGMVPMNAGEDPFSATGAAVMFPDNYDMNQGHFAPAPPPAMAQTYGEQFNSSPVEEHFQIPEYSLRILTHQSTVYPSPPIDYADLMQQQQGGLFPANYNLAPTAAPAAPATTGTEGTVLPRAMSTPALNLGGWTSQEVSPRRGVSTAAPISTSLAPETPIQTQVQLQASPVKTKAKSRAPKKKITDAKKVVDLVFQNFDASHAHKICSAVAPSGSSKAKKKAEEEKRLARMMAKERKGSDASELSSVVEEVNEKGEEGAIEA